jgi:hypothetical protein
MELEKFRHFLGMKDDQYLRFKDFNLYVLKPAVKEINTKTELFVEIEREKTGRKISGIKFLISKNKNQPASTIQESMLPIEEDIFNLGEKQKIFDTIKSSCPGILESTIKKIIAENSAEKIEIALKYTKERAEKNPAAYLNEILKNENFGEEEIQSRKKREENLKRKKEEFLKKEEEEKAEKLKKEKVSEFIEKNPEIFEKILKEQKEIVKNQKFSPPKKAAEKLALIQARGEISKIIENK